MKKIKSIIGILCLALGFAACGSGAPTSLDASKTNQTALTTSAVTPAILSVTVSSDISTVGSAGQAVLSVVVTGTNQFSNAVTWSILGDNGTLSAKTGSSVIFTAPNNSTLSNSTIFVIATSVQDSSKTANVALTIKPTAAGSSITGVNVTAIPTTSVAANATSELTATTFGTGAFGSGVIWSIVSGGGTINAVTGANITFTAPAFTNPTNTVITATSVQDPTKSGTVTLGINAVIPPASSITSVSIAASNAALRESAISSLVATVTGTGVFDNNVIWAIEAGGIGTLSSTTGNTVFYTAPALVASPTSSVRVVQITARSLQDPEQKKTIFLSINPKKAIVAGLEFSVALKSDGTPLSWGSDNAGQLGNGTVSSNQVSPVSVAVENKSLAIAVGNSHSLALKVDGTLLSWGNNSAGQLGINSPIGSQVSPVSVVNATDIIAIAAGDSHSLALKSDGTLLSWGNDFDGQLGNGAVLGNQFLPVPVANATNIVAIAAGKKHSLALKSDGTLLSWGSDTEGQLGDGAVFANQVSPVPVINATGIIAIAAGGSHTLALKSDGTLLSWGSDNAGQLGNGTVSGKKASPVSVVNASGIIAISAGDTHSLALKSDGTLLSWGNDSFGQLGNGAVIGNQVSPVSVVNASGIIAISAGGIHSLALKSDSTVFSWGNDSSGQLGNGVVTGNQVSPVTIGFGAFTVGLP
jgi:alpha-tubulin suppressor-like RCC1 family protein